jgi:hypothetical protein
MRSFLAQRPYLPPEQSSDNQVKIGDQICLACASSCRMSTQHEQATPGKRGDPPAHEFPEPSLYPVANHRRANCTANNEAYLWPGIGWNRPSRHQQRTGYDGTTGPAARAQRAPELVRAPHPRLLGEHHTSCAAWAARAVSPLEAGSDGEPLAALAATGGQHGAAGAGPHAQAEAVDLRPPTVVRLERTLAHWNSRLDAM